MAAGKNKVERGFRVWWDDSGGTPRDLSGDLVPGSLSITDEYEEADITGVSEGLRHYLANMRAVEVTASFHMNDTASTGSTTVLNGQNGSTGTLTLQWGASGVAATQGDPELEGECIQLRNASTLDGNKFVHNVTWRPTGTGGFAWGTMA
jgi:hypothetical protein